MPPTGWDVAVGPEGVLGALRTPTPRTQSGVTHPAVNAWVLVDASWVFAEMKPYTGSTAPCLESHGEIMQLQGWHN